MGAWNFELPTDLSEKAVAAAVANIPAFDSETDDVRAGIDAYLRFLACQGDPLVRLIEVAAFLRSKDVVRLIGRANAEVAALLVERRFQPTIERY